jgi:hypothetical protein
LPATACSSPDMLVGSPLATVTTLVHLELSTLSGGWVRWVERVHQIAVQTLPRELCRMQLHHSCLAAMLLLVAPCTAWYW